MAAPSKVAKVEEGAEAATPSSIESSPDQDQDAGAEQPQEPAQPQKRKGGRKPIYATSEERKQRNRQAQAAFRERRTEYIKQLEATIKHNEENLSSLQQSQRTAADECLMLRYKNSLLERILLEKGIDVQAELQMKTGSPVLGPGFMHPAATMPPQPPLQRTALQRQQARRSGQNFLPKLAPGQSNPDMGFTTSPHAHPTPSSHASSPSQLSTRSLALQQGGMTSPASAVLAQPQAQHFQSLARSSQPQPNQAFYQAQQQPANGPRQPQQRPTPASTYQGSQSGMSTASTFSYPSPFQKHFDQLDQEYDTQHSRSMLDEPDDDNLRTHRSPQSQGQYPQHYQNPQEQTSGDYYNPPQGMQQGQHQLSPHSQYEQMQQMIPTSHPNGNDGPYEVDPNDPMLDADPFGLSASMHYPTTYSFEQHHGQR
ncbi:uncharacterized protein MYCFIDRAFT_184912 [Pseudocercospora fijiensis CIRAD86]|uniref:BZIP domain-containing protein n=1 Tax=Pseudocercospora fijiensis (strain CIRAD86) TaxID=383855 RepID=N1QAU5_PSEFD|nr:uncharacterized protein MYCFIDRAFT_184912 [Pseudocercospora fijiensis CIRAD86]EME88123.1 hypothetical protein MYCFIDRAFT_184912 [Pseudocercospora fijiensis CIRAD86]